MVPMNDKTATERTQELLDERGVEHEDYAYVVPETGERTEITRVRDMVGRIVARFMSCNEPGKVDVAVKLTRRPTVYNSYIRSAVPCRPDTAVYISLCDFFNHAFARARLYIIPIYDRPRADLSARTRYQAEPGRWHVWPALYNSYIRFYIRSAIPCPPRYGCLYLPLSLLSVECVNEITFVSGQGAFRLIRRRTG